MSNVKTPHQPAPEQPGARAAAEFVANEGFRFRVSPTTDPVWRNTIRLAWPRPVACWRIEHAYFRFDSSVILPDITDELERLKPLIGDGRVATIFGHADPVGKVDYNSHLSARRARALYGLLTRNVDVWLKLFEPVDYDHWSVASTQQFLQSLQRKDGSGTYYRGTVDGAYGSLTDDAICSFQRDESGSGLKVDGIAGPKTRRRLYELYMDLLTRSPEQALMRPDQFLGAPDPNSQGDSPDKAAYQGCGEHNPSVIFSKQKEQEFSASAEQAERDLANAPNRRTVVYFFRVADFGKKTPEQLREIWPCPTWNEGNKGCQAKFWKNSTKRLANGDQDRLYAKGERTMACAWYDQFARPSPCERGDSDQFVIGLPEALWHSLPAELEFRLERSDGTTQVIQLAALSVSSEQVWLRFRRVPEGSTVTLLAVLGAQQRTLCQDQLVDDDVPPYVNLAALNDFMRVDEGPEAYDEVAVAGEIDVPQEDVALV